MGELAMDFRWTSGGLITGIRARLRGAALSLRLAKRHLSTFLIPPPWGRSRKSDFFGKAHNSLDFERQSALKAPSRSLYAPTVHVRELRFSVFS